MLKSETIRNESDGQHMPDKLWSLYTLSFVSGCSLGIFNPMISVLMKHKNIEEFWIGAHSTVYFSMMALGTIVVPYLMVRFRLKNIIVIGLIITACSALLLPVFETLMPWFFLRLLMGLGVSFYMVCGQTLLNLSVKEDNRAISNGIYTLAFALGFGFGPILGTYLYSLNSHYSFIAGACLMLSAAIISFIYLAEKQGEVLIQKFSVWNKISPALLAILAYGFAEATLVSLFPLFLLEIGSNIKQIGLSFFAFVAGSLIMTLPIMKVADIFGISKVLKSIIVFGTVMMISLSLQSEFSYSLFIFAFFCGASIGIIYPLAMAYISQKLEKKEMASGMNQLTFYFGIGCAIGPIVSASLIEFTNNRQVFTATLIMFFIVMIYSTFQPSKMTIQGE